MIIQLETACGECMGTGQVGDRYCVGCGGTGKEIYEPQNKCESCGQLSDDLEVVEERDDETGYYSTSAVCDECREAVKERKQREAEDNGGLRADVLMLLGVDESWMYEGTTAPKRPVGRETAPRVSAGDFAEEKWLGGGM